MVKKRRMMPSIALAIGTIIIIMVARAMGVDIGVVFGIYVYMAVGILVVAVIVLKEYDIRGRSRRNVRAIGDKLMEIVHALLWLGVVMALIAMIVIKMLQC